MLRWPCCIILSLFILGGFVQVNAQEELPFYRLKPKLWEKITESRRVVVSVNVEEEKKEQKVRIVGVGAVNVPIYFAIEQIQRFEELPNVSGHFEKVRHNKEKQEVYFFLKAMGTQVRLIQKYKWGELKADSAQMDWLVTWGKLKGMVGHYRLRKISSSQTEIAIWASMKKPELPLPEFLLNFTLEVIAEKTAKKMRGFMEENFRQAKQIREDYVQKR